MDPAQAPLAPTPEQLAQLEHLREVLTKSLTYMSCLYTCLLFDWMVTLPQEYERFWKRKWNVSTFLFFLNRYFGLAALTVVEVMFNAKISYKTCERIVWLEPGMLLVMVLAAETLLVMRVWALWDRAWWVPCIFVIMVAAEIGISIFALVGSKPLLIPPQLNIHACILNATPRNEHRLWLYWFGPVATDSVIVLLTIIRSWQLHIRTGGAKVPLLMVLVRDGLIFYIVVLVANLLNVIWFRTKPITDNQALHAPLAMVVTTMAAARLALSMRDPAYGEASAASISRYQTTKGGDTTWTGSHFTGKSDPVPTFPLQSLRLGDNSNIDLDDAEKEAGLTRLDSNSQGAEQHLASSNANARAYKGIYIQSETSRKVAVGSDQPKFDKPRFE